MILKIKCLILSTLIFNTVNSFPQFTITKSNDDLFPLSIIHVNDFHARFEEVDPWGGPCKSGSQCVGGYSRVVYKIKELKEIRKDKNPIYLDAGDNFQGTLWYNIGRWNVTQEFLNYLPADAITIGNHEFDNDIEGLVPFLEALKAPVVVANIDDSKEPTIHNLYNKSVVIEKSGRKIGIIGVILESTNEISNTGKLIFLNESISVKEEAEILKSKGVNIVIVLSHCGYDVDQIIAKNVGPDVDVIVGAHSHTFLYSDSQLPGPDKPRGPYPTLVTQEDTNHTVLILQASAYSKYVGDLTVYFDKKGIFQYFEGQPHYINSEVPKDPFIEKALKPWKSIIDTRGNELIGYTAVELTKSDCGSGECNLGNMFSDALVYEGLSLPVSNSNYWANASIAIANQDLTYSHLVTLSPFENKLEVLSIKGKYLLQALEHSVYSANHLSPLSCAIDNDEVNFNFRNMLQVSGMKIVYDLNKPDDQRVQSVLIRCWECQIPRYNKLEEDETYRIITTSFVADGGDGYSMIKENKFDTSEFSSDVEAVTNYVRHNSPITTGKEGRIRFV
ncbi:apyrase isoform X2 [Condylostylus longicornis]|uniref:apyrase isoform X2 n=1 Tax=Condylostylus longicornis TaxID=2530218 RepID=UPI00244DA216|nr:apyrase isoform X2 [Condylostylus longicornis]